MLMVQFDNLLLVNKSYKQVKTFKELVQLVHKHKSESQQMSVEQQYYQLLQ